MVPPAREVAGATLRLALPVGVVVERETVPADDQVTWICGSGVPLLDPTIVPPPLTVQDIWVLEFQLPEMVYVYWVPVTTQVGPLIEVCAFPLYQPVKSSKTTEAIFARALAGLKVYCI